MSAYATHCQTSACSLLLGQPNVNAKFSFHRCNKRPNQNMDTVFCTSPKDSPRSGSGLGPTTSTHFRATQCKQSITANPAFQLRYCLCGNRQHANLQKPVPCTSRSVTKLGQEPQGPQGQTRFRSSAITSTHWPRIANQTKLQAAQTLAPNEQKIEARLTKIASRHLTGVITIPRPQAYSTGAGSFTCTGSPQPCCFH